MSRFLFCLLFCLYQFAFCFSSPFGKGSGSSSFQLLQLSLSPSTISLAGAGVAYSHSIHSQIELNPALTFDSPSELSFSQVFSFQEFQADLSNLVFGINDNNQSFFGGIRFLGFEPIEGFDQQGNSTTAFDAYSLKLQLGYQRFWTTKISTGASLSYALNNISNFFDQVILLDLGIAYQIISPFSLAFSLTNLDLVTVPKSITPPVTLRIGGSYYYSFHPKFNLTLVGDLKKITGESLEIPIGLNAQIYRFFKVQIGKPFLNSSQKFALGFGLTFPNFDFDYSIQLHQELSASQAIAILLKF